MTTISAIVVKKGSSQENIVLNKAKNEDSSFTAISSSKGIRTTTTFLAERYDVQAPVLTVGCDQPSKIAFDTRSLFVATILKCHTAPQVRNVSFLAVYLNVNKDS